MKSGKHPKLIAILLVLVVPSVNAEKEEHQDKFTQRDLKIATLLNQLHYYYVEQDKFSAELRSAGRIPKDPRFGFFYQIAGREAEIDKLVGCKQIIDQLTVELSQMKEKGLGPKHPHLLWIERLIAGLEAYVNEKPNKPAHTTPDPP